MKSLRLIAIAFFLFSFMGCATFQESLDGAMVTASNIGHDFLSGSSEFLGATVEVSFALIGADVDVPTIPWRDTDKTRKVEDHQGGKTASSERRKSEPVISVMEYISRAMRDYRSFEYDQAAENATKAVKMSKTASEMGQAHLIRGACFYLLNNLSRSKQDFAVAKFCGVESMDPRLFPRDMIRFFESSR